MSAPKEDVRWTYEAVCPSLRFEAAKAAMQGMLANPSNDDRTASELAECAVYFADALLAALAKPEAKAQEKSCWTCAHEETAGTEEPCNGCDEELNKWEAKR